MSRLQTLLLWTAVPLCAFVLPQRLSAQTDVNSLATTVAAAWARHDFVTVVGGGRVELRIAGVSAAGPLPSDQAAALLTGYARGAQEIEVGVVTATAVSDGTGYAQLRRQYRRQGVGEPREETILLGLVRSPGGEWRVSVVEVSGAQR